MITFPRTPSLNFGVLDAVLPILVVARCKAWICGRSIAGTAGSNPVAGMDVCLLRELCVVT